ncbi:MAG: TlpA family protein disulfide reductase [Clostridia bacterium]|nr:TlpA family protein disulfide reductase [Clostridia bacterium]
MRKRVLSLFLLTALFLTAFSFTACKDEQFTVNDCVFTSFTAEDYDGNIIDETVFAEYKITMISVWGTQCDGCRVEAPELVEINSEYASKGFQVIGIPVDKYTKQQASDAVEVIDELHIDFRNLKVYGNNVKQFVLGVEHLPYTIFVNAEGKQIGGGYSGAKSKTEWKKLIDSMLEFVSK